jgi:hypothetical protein
MPIEIMNTSPFQDPRATDLLSRVSEDVSLLRQDIGNLISHARRHTLPDGVRGLAESARKRLAASRFSSADPLRSLRNPANQPATAWIGGAMVVGLIAAGIYLFCKSDDCTDGLEDEDGDQDEDENEDGDEDENEDG